MDSPPAVSIIIPTVGRESLAKAVQSALDQQLDGGWIEVIVVNDTGQPLPDCFHDLLANPRVTVLTTSRRRQAVARNTGAAISRAPAYLFLDDDDWLIPNGLSALVDLLDESPTAVAVYGSTLVVGNMGHGDAELGLLNAGADVKSASQMLSGAAIPVGGLLCRSEAFWRVGGYAPPPAEDVDLCRSLSLIGDFAHTSTPVSAYYLGAGWHTTTDYALVLERLRISREHMLDQDGALARLVAQTRCHYWRGRNIWSLAASIRWNLGHRRPLKAASRVLQCLALLLVSVPSLLYRDFWRGLVDNRPRGSMQRLLADAARDTADIKYPDDAR